MLFNVHVPYTHTRRGPALGGLDLAFFDDLSQIIRFPRLPTARSVQRAKARRSWMELAIAHPTTKSFFESDVVLDLQLKKSTAFREFQMGARRGVGCRPVCSSLILNRCAPSEYRFACDPLRDVCAAFLRFCKERRPPNALHWPLIMDARCVLSPLHRSSSSAWLRSVQRADPDV